MLANLGSRHSTTSSRNHAAPASLIRMNTVLPVESHAATDAIAAVFSAGGAASSKSTMTAPVPFAQALQSAPDGCRERTDMSRDLEVAQWTFKKPRYLFD